MLPRQPQQPIHVEMRLDVIGERVERAFDPGAIVLVRRRHAEPREKGAAEEVGREEAVQIGAMHESIGGDGAFRLSINEGKRPRAVGALGEFGVLAEHVNFITSIEPGLITLKLADGSFIEYLLSGGIAEVKDGAMTVLATEALPLAAVDPAAAAPEVQQAEARLSQMSFYDPGYQEAEQALRNARARAEIAHLSRLAH